MPIKVPTKSAGQTKHLVLVTHEFYPHRGGIAIYAAEMARAASQAGYEVEVWAPALPPGMSEPVRDYPVRRLLLDGNHSLLSQWRMVRQLLKHRKRLRECTLYIPEPGPLLAMLFLQYFDRLRPAQLVLTFHGSEIQRLASRRLLRWSTSRLLRQATRVSVVSHHARELLERHFPEAAETVVLTRGALRTDLAAPAANRTHRADGKIVILTVARLNPRKGQLEVIMALQALPPAQRARVEYWLVGSHGKENYDTMLSTAASAAGFSVKMLGDIPDEKLGELYAQADIFAMTSMPHKHSVEGFGLVYLEAGSYGLPVVAHDIGGVPEAVLDGETGLLVAPGDTVGLTAAFARLIADPDLRRRLGEIGRARAASHTWQDAAKALFGQSGSAPPT